MTKVAVVVSHPIQYFCAQYSSWAKLPDIELNVIFASKHGLIPYEDRDFGRTIQWSGPTLDFPHQFLKGADTRKLGRKIDSPDLDAYLFSVSPDALIVYGYSQREIAAELGLAQSTVEKHVALAVRRCAGYMSEQTCEASARPDQAEAHHE